jgi:hypothetical protein
LLSYGIPSLDDFAPLHPDRPAIVVIALPWQPASETPFVVTQAFARQGYRPLCVHRGWSRDGAAMSAQDLRSDGALSGEADMLLMVDPKYKKGTADLLVVENWQGPTGEFPGVAWPELPRTAARRSD